MDDRLMTVRELAAYLKVNERTVLKLAAQGPLPAVRVGNQWRFRKVMIDAWLDDQMLGISHRYLEVPRASATVPMMLELENCFAPQQVVPELAAKTKTEVIEELAEYTAKLSLVSDKHWFVGALVERENVMPTAVGNGLAFLHTLRRHPDQVMRPFMVLGRSRAGVDFDALDGAPTHLFFVLGLVYRELHLPWLTKLAQMLAAPAARDELLTVPSAEQMYDVLVMAERRLRESSSAAIA